MLLSVFGGMLNLTQPNAAMLLSVFGRMLNLTQSNTAMLSC